MLHEILSTLFGYLETIEELPPLYYPNREELPPSETHLRVDVIPDTNYGITYTSVSESGILQLNIYMKQDVGPVAPARIAADVLAAFPRNFSISGIRFDSHGSISRAFFDDPWYVTPVTLHYHFISK